MMEISSIDSFLLRQRTKNYNQQTTIMNSTRILIAEDDFNIRIGLIDTLESEGYHAAGAADGIKALKMFKEDKYDLVILDIMMPGKSGYDVCKEIRRQNEEVPVLMP